MSKASWCVFNSMLYAAVHISPSAISGQRKLKNIKWRNWSNLTFQTRSLEQSDLFTERLGACIK